MADPFGIIGLLGVAAQIIEIALDFGSDWGDVPEDIRALISELQGLKAVLSVTHINILTHDSFYHDFRTRRAENLSRTDIAEPSMATVEMVSSCKAGLEDLLKILKEYKNGHREVARLLQSRGGSL